MVYDIKNSTFVNNDAALLKNHNFVNPTSFSLFIDKLVAPNVAYSVQQVNLPDLSIDVANYPTPKMNLGVHADKITYGVLDFTFLVDEYLINYKEIHDWMLAQINEDDSSIPKARDITLVIIASNGTPARSIKFIDAFPINISPITFDTTATDVEYVTASVSMKYSYLTLE